MKRNPNHESLPTRYQWGRAVVEVLRALGGKAHIDEYHAKLVGHFALSPDQMGIRLNGEVNKKAVWKNDLEWAQTDLRGAGLLENPSRAQWSLTPAGKKIGLDDIEAAMREVDDERRRKRVLKKRPKPENAEEQSKPNPRSPTPAPGPLAGTDERRVHIDVQRKLARLGAIFNYDVWIARNDRSSVSDGVALGTLPRVIQALPRMHDLTHVMNTIEYIDVIWLEKNKVVCAFEVEQSTNIYSGILRLSDLMATANVNMELFIVSSDRRRSQFLNAISRPTFDQIEPPLRKKCGFLSYAAIDKLLSYDEEDLMHMRATVLRARSTYAGEAQEFNPALELKH